VLFFIFRFVYPGGNLVTYLRRMGSYGLLALYGRDYDGLILLVVLYGVPRPFFDQALRA